MNVHPSVEPHTEKAVTVGYARTFRIIGASLEKLRVEEFDLEIKEGKYHIRGSRKAARLPAAGSQKEQSGFLQGWRRIRSRFFSEPQVVSFEIRFNDENLLELDTDSQSQRGNSLRYPDVHSLSETLRAVGELLDLKHAAISLLSMRGRWVTLHYKSPDGHLVVEEHTAASLYSLWVSMCGRRTGSAKAPRAPNHHDRGGPNRE